MPYKVGKAYLLPDAVSLCFKNPLHIIYFSHLNPANMSESGSDSANHKMGETNAPAKRRAKQPSSASTRKTNLQSRGYRAASTSSNIVPPEPEVSIVSGPKLKPTSKDLVASNVNKYYIQQMIRCR